MVASESHVGAARARWSRIWRLAIGVSMVVVLLTAQFMRADDWFPLGSLGQYAYPRDPDGAVINTYMTGVTIDGDEVRIGLTTASAGITRVELETQLGALTENPSILAGIVAVWESNRPGVELASVAVRQTVHRMQNGALHGDVEERVVLEWEVP